MKIMSSDLIFKSLDFSPNDPGIIDESLGRK